MKLRAAYPEEIARSTGLSNASVRYALFGSAGRYKASLALVHLGLVEVAATANGPVFCITPSGLVAARDRVP